MSSELYNQLETYANQVIPNLWLGSEDASTIPLEVLKRHNITHILVCAAGLVQQYPNDITYMQIKAYDIPGYSMIVHFPACCDFISTALQTGGILVHW